MVDVEELDELFGEHFIEAISPLQLRVTGWYTRLEQYTDEDVVAVFNLDLERIDGILSRKAVQATLSEIAAFVGKIEIACGPVPNESVEQSSARMAVTAETVTLAKPSLLALELAYFSVLRAPDYRVTTRTMFHFVEDAQKKVETICRLLRGDPVVGIRKKLQSSAEYRSQKRGEADLRKFTERLTQRFYAQPELLPSGMKDPDED